MKNIILKYGVLLTLNLLFIFGISYAMDTHIDPPWWYSLLGLIATILTFIYGYKAFKNENGNLMTYGDAIKIGLGIALITGILMSIFRYLLVTTIDPGFIKESVRLFKIHHSDLPMEVEEGKGLMRASVMSIIEFITTFFLGLFVASIIGFFMRTNKKSNN